MGRTTANEKKEEWLKFRVRPSLKEKIEKLQAGGAYQNMTLQEFIVVLLYRGLQVQEQLEEVEITVAVNTAKEVKEQKSDIKGGAARRDTK